MVLTTDPVERATLTALLDGDIYTAIATEGGVTKDRDELKVDFMRFMNGAVRNYVHTFFHQHLPRLTERIVEARRAEEATEKGVAWFETVHDK